MVWEERLLQVGEPAQAQDLRKRILEACGVEELYLAEKDAYPQQASYLWRRASLLPHPPSVHLPKENVRRRATRPTWSKTHVSAG